MNATAFRDSLRHDAPPDGLSTPLIALWHDGRDEWTRAHDAVQDDESLAGAWVHAYLHRKEGDASNARYWYQRAGKPEFRGSLEKEWEAIVLALVEA